jgi:hypothetical protein
LESNDNYYDYQALSFIVFERGIVRAASKAQAKAVLRAHGYRLFYLWPHGKRPWWSWEPMHDMGSGGVKWFPFHLNEYVIDGQIIYKYPRWGSYLSSIIILLLASPLFYVSLVDKESFWIALTGFMVLLGIIVALFDSQIIIDKSSRNITILKKILMFCSSSRSYNSDQIESIKVSKAFFYDSDTTYSLFLVTLCLGEIDIQVTCSTSYEKTVKFAKKVANNLGVPCCNETVDRVAQNATLSRLIFFLAIIFFVCYYVTKWSCSHFRKGLICWTKVRSVCMKSRRKL